MTKRKNIETRIQPVEISLGREVAEFHDLPYSYVINPTECTDFLVYREGKDEKGQPLKPVILLRKPRNCEYLDGVKKFHIGHELVPREYFEIKTA